MNGPGLFLSHASAGRGRPRGQPAASAVSGIYNSIDERTHQSRLPYLRVPGRGGRSAASPTRCGPRAWKSGSTRANCAAVMRGITKIRKQIRECALFVPVISANTQSRARSYSGSNGGWPTDSTELMGKSKAFLLPVCVDDTRDAEAD